MYTPVNTGQSGLPPRTPFKKLWYNAARLGNNHLAKHLGRAGGAATLNRT